ncbi:MAG: hypothetical protein JWM33_676 [Caulobacteraceae bacterium]|nr:hypothetical protein [Caulobacteraceae bacterium]
MRKLPIAAAAVISLMGVAGSVPAVTEAMTRPPTAQEQMNNDRCLRPGDIDSFKVGANNVVNLRLDGGTYYQVTLRDPCNGLILEKQIAIENRARSSWVCNGEDINILTRSPEVASGRCTIQSFRKLSPSEAAALPQAEKP